MQFDIRAELPGSTLWDFQVVAQPRERGAVQTTDGITPAVTTPAFRVARELAGEKIREHHGDNAQLEWRGMVVFVNRDIPLAKAHPLWPKGAGLRWLKKKHPNPHPTPEDLAR